MPSLDQQIYDLYSDQLRILKHGHALYEPEPNKGEGEVQIGDVGYIDFGRFMRFANVFTSEHGIPAVDEKHRAIIKLAKLDKGVMSSRSVHSERVEFDISASQKQVYHIGPSSENWGSSASSTTSPEPQGTSSRSTSSFRESNRSSGGSATTTLLNPVDKKPGGYYTGAYIQATCANCQTRNTPLWRRGPEGQPLCNAYRNYTEQCDLQVAMGPGSSKRHGEHCLFVIIGNEVLTVLQIGSEPWQGRQHPGYPKSSRRQ